MPNCCTGTDFEKSLCFYVSKRNPQQRDPIMTLLISTGLAMQKKKKNFLDYDLLKI